MMMLRERDKLDIRERLKDMVGPVKLVYFTQELECEFCRETGQLLKEVKELSNKIQLEVYNFQLDRDKVQEFKIDKIPATVVMSEKDYGIRFYGIPAGYEFASFLDAMLMVSRGDSGLSQATRDKLKAVNEPIHIQVFVTPT